MSTAVGQWRSALSQGVAERAVRVATEIAERMRNPPEPGATDHEVIETAVGIALLHGELDRHRPGAGWDRAAHAHLARAATAAERSGPGSSGLCGGVGGVAFAAWSLSRGGERYRRLMTELDRGVIAGVTTRAELLSESPSGPPAHLIDVINGLAGSGGYLVRRKEKALSKVLEALVALSGEENGLPRWHIPQRSLVAGAALPGRYPDGYLDCGLAHGIAGPMALLALARRAGVEVEGQREAIGRMAGWLAGQRVFDDWGVNWPAAVELGGNRGEPAHAAWCYGSPGVARALWLAGEALEDGALQELAVSAMKAVHTRPAEARRVDRTPGLCHGIGGLLTITLRFAHDTGDPAFAEAAVPLTEQLVAMYEPDRPYGYYALNSEGAKVDQPGLLDGAAGVALALLTAGTGAEPTWDGMLLLS
ncbi:lanthionine synthetase C family protein [Kutzneria sp. NPDC052558]|uniref:lanthionine synthetase C family protein n=1 Tax=Kutzneria sp. NPDC052558 TaxID=3364121 RepID=UPI0037C9A0C7